MEVQSNLHPNQANYMALLGKVQRGQAITAEMLNNIIDNIRECQLQSVVGGVFRRGTGGTTITVKAGQQGAEATSCPFDVTGAISGTDLILSVRAGLVNGVLPSNIFDKLTTTTSGQKFVVINCDTDGKNVVSASLEVTETMPVPPESTEGVAPDAFGVIIAAITGGIIYKAIPCGNILARVTPSVQVDSATYVAGARNYFQYYNWLF